jgi:hypothetical protein
MRALLALGLCSLVLLGCATTTGPAPHTLAEAFRQYPLDPRIRLEEGAEGHAARVHALLDAAIARVERVHGLPFRAPPAVAVCATAACFARLVKTPGLTAAVVADNRLVLSPRLFSVEADRLPGILAHELSHVHLGQRLGHYTPWIPVWFHEGLATLVADGGGADLAGDRVACAAWRNGQRVDFGRRDAPGQRHRADAFGLSIHVFYRQSWRATERLRAHDPQAFRRWLIAIQEGADFSIAFADAYNNDLVALVLRDLEDNLCRD